MNKAWATMHEMSIAQSILEAVETEAGRHPGSRVLEVGLRIGEWAGVDPEALRFCFEAMQAGSGKTAPVLHIEMMPRTDRCLKCGATFPADGQACPQCGASQTTPAGGTELEFSYMEIMEIEEPDASRAGTQSPE